MRRMRLVWMLTLIVFLLAACGSSDNDSEPVNVLPTQFPTSTPVPIPTEAPTLIPTLTPAIIPQTVAENPADQAYVRIINAIPNGPDVDVSLEALTMAFNLRYSRITESTGIVGGTYTLLVTTSAGQSEGDAQPLIQQPFSIFGGQSLILLIAGTPEAPSLSVFPEYTDPLNARESRISLINAVANAPAVSLQQNNVDIALPIEFGQQSIPTVVATGPATFVAQSGGQVIATESTELRERRSYTFVIMGSLDAPETISTASFETRVAGLASVRVINASSETGAIDVYLNAKPFATNLDFTRATERQTISGETYVFEVFNAGTNPETDTPLTTSQFNITPDNAVAFIIAGPANRLDIIRYAEDLSPTPPDQARIAFANTLNDVSTATIAPIEAPPISNNEVSRPILVDANTYDFTWLGADGASVEFVENVQLDAGRNYIYFLTGRVEQPPLILSDNVGVNEQLGLIVDTESVDPVRVRFANMVFTNPAFDFLIDGIPVTTNLQFLQLTNPFISLAGTHEVSIRQSGQEFDLTSIGYAFEQAKEYTIYVYGHEAADANILIVNNPETFTDDTRDSVRLINLTNDTFINLGLGYVEYSPELDITQPPAEVTEPPPDGAPPPETSQTRQPLVGGINRLVNNIAPATASNYATITVGQNTIYIIDNDLQKIAHLLSNQTFLPNTRYDVVTFQIRDSEIVNAYVIPYTSP